MRHIDHVVPDGFDADTLVSWYKQYQPVGSGPISTMRHMCALIEQLAMDRNIVLPPAKGLPKQKKPKKSTPSKPPLIVRVREHISEQVGIKINPGVDDEKPWEDFELDSLDLVEIVMRVEDEFDITIPDDVAQTLISVEKIVSYLQSQNIK